jgi:hypothetical protein
MEVSKEDHSDGTELFGVSGGADKDSCLSKKWLFRRVGLPSGDAVVKETIDPNQQQYVLPH